jgi:HNH endonuclease
MSKVPLVRFMEKVSKQPAPDGCWLWTGALSEKGYGFFKVHPKQVKAHRFAYEAFVGTIPQGMLVCHSCDVPACVNPAHLFVADQKTNIADMLSKGRQPDYAANAHHLPKARIALENNPALRARGERINLAKLTEVQVRDIRHLHATGDWSLRELAHRFGVGRSCIHSIVHRQTWQHVE